MTDSKYLLVDFYDNLYERNPSVFGDTSSGIFTDVFEQAEVPRGKALDIGAGEGIASIFLAKKGFSVTALDISKNAFAAIKKENELAIQTVHKDILDFEMTSNYAVVCSFFVFHHAEREKILGILRKIQDGTMIGGVNIFTFFTKEGAFFRNDPTTKNFFSEKGEMENLYKGWKILVNKEYESRAATVDMKNTVQVLVAQKIS